MAGRTRAPKKDRAQAPPTTSMVASAVRYSGGKVPRIYQGAKEWQRDAYRHYGICGEARYAATYYGNALSKCTLYAAQVDATSGVESKVEHGSSAQVYLDTLFNGRESQASAMKAIGTHLTIAGECYLIGRALSDQEREDMPPGIEMDDEIWEIASVLEVHVAGSKWSVRYADNRSDITLSDEDVVIRIWTPMPGSRMDADSPFRSLLPTLAEIEQLTKHIFAQATSRLTGAGILFLSQNMTFPPPPEVLDDHGNPVVLENDADRFMATLAEGMMTPLEDPSSPSAVIPIIATVPDEVVDKAKLMHFWSDLDAKALEMRNNAILRFAQGMDLPVEKVLGMSSNTGTGGGTSNGASHWTAWQIDEDMIKLHIEPMLEVICGALTIMYLRPLTEGDERVRADTSALRLRPDRSKEAILLYNMGVISAEALLRENGFAPEDAPTPEEFQRWVLIKVATGSATPEQMQEAAKALGVDIAPPQGTPQSAPRQMRPDPSLEDKPVRDMPERQAAAVLLAAAEPLVLRALERAGNRLRVAMKGSAPVCESFATHTFVQATDPDYVLADAWSTAEIVLDGIVPDIDAAVDMLDGYVRVLLATQARYDRATLKHWLTEQKVAAA